MSIIRPDQEKQIQASLENGLLLGEGFLSFHLVDVEDQEEAAFYEDFGCSEHRLMMGELTPGYFTFNEPVGACVTCSGLGTYLQVHPDLLMPDKSRSIMGGAFVREAFKYDKNSPKHKKMCDFIFCFTSFNIGHCRNSERSDTEGRAR